MKIYLGCDTDVYAEELALRGALQEGATLSWTLYESDRTSSIATGGMTADGSDYLGTIADSVTGGLTLDARYWVQIAAEKDGATTKFWIPCAAKLYPGEDD